jgi:transposase
VRVHSRYGRTLADTTVAGRPAVVRLTVRRFFCSNQDCPVATFAEQVPGLTAPYARRTPSLTVQLTAIGLALAGRAGARLAGALGMWTSRSTLLRLLRALPVTVPSRVRVVGVDDFALRRGHVYGTVLLDMDTHRPVDLLPDREADTFADWLRGRDGVEVVCRDRATAYAQAATDAAPTARQVADRWHLWHNLGEYVDKTVARHLPCLHRPTQAPEELRAPLDHTHTDAHDIDGAADAHDIDGGADGVVVQEEDEAEGVGSGEPGAVATRRRRDGALVQRTRERYEAVHALLTQGKGVKTIVRELGLARGTVRRFARASSVEELLTVPLTGRPSLLDEHLDHVHQRWNDGVTTAMTLYRELQQRGFCGSYGTVRDHVKDLRDPDTPPERTTPPGRPVKARTLAGWILRRPDTLKTEEKDDLEQARDRCPHLNALAGYVTDFAIMLTGLHGDRLDTWLTNVEHDPDQPDLHSFAAATTTPSAPA